jgi:hypothetical protein
VVADGVAGFAAEDVDEDGAGGVTGGGIEGDVSLLDVEGAVNDVEGVGEGEVDFAAVGVQGELVLSLVLSVQDCGGGGDQQEGVAKEVSRTAGGTVGAVELGGEGTPWGSLRVRRGRRVGRG